MSHSKPVILIAEDDSGFAKQLKETLEGENYRVLHAKNGHEAIYHLKNDMIDLGFLDLAMPGMDGLEVLEKASKIAPDIPLIMITGYASIDKAVKATQLGAYDFIEKPVSLNHLLLAASHALEKRFLNKKTQWLEKDLDDRYRMIGNSQAMQEIYRIIKQISKVQSPVLITGETGTGKELVARALHKQSPRSNEPFVKINCAAIPDTLIESELFGHKKGSFTGAVTDQTGKFIQAHHGTLFLDEIGDLSLSAQAKLLRVLQDQKVDMVGSEKTISVDVRVIAATNKNFEVMLKNDFFRKDLFYRINNFNIHLPPLRERKEDIPDLVKHFLALSCEEYNQIVPDLKTEVIQEFLCQDWPGNVRELKMLIDRLIVFSEGHSISADQIKSQFKDSTQLPGLSYKEAMKMLERNYLTDVLIAHEWNVANAAKTIGLDRTNLYKKMQNLSISKS